MKPPPLRLDRRALLAGLGALLPLASARAEVSTRRPRVILLGTKGGPRPGKTRFGPSAALVVDGEIHVVDCGDGVATQLRRAGLLLKDIRHVYLSHLHSDHTADFGNLLYFAWYSGLKKPIYAWGPPEIRELTKAALAYHAHDVRIRMEDEGRRTMEDLVVAHPLEGPGEFVRTPRVRVRAALANHPPVEPSFCFRFDTRAGSVVFSGDTAPTERLVALAKGADLLIHEAVYKPALDRHTDRLASLNARFRRHLDQSHTTTEQLGKIAAEAEVKKLVLTHLVPGADPSITDEMWLKGVRKHYRGPAVVGRDLMVIPLGGAPARRRRAP